MDTMRELADKLIADGMATPETIIGCAPEEIEALRADHGVSVLPEQYEDFLRVMGRQAGNLLRGTDFFHPNISGLDEEGRELLAEKNVEHLLPAGAIVIGIHGGGELYWLETAEQPGRVSWYKETRAAVFRTWPSLLEFLTAQADAEREALS